MNRKSGTGSREHFKFPSKAKPRPLLILVFFEPIEKCVIFKDIFSRTFQEQSDFPGLSR